MNWAILQGGGPTRVFNASLVATIKEIKRHDKKALIFGIKNTVNHFNSLEPFILNDLSDENLELLKNTPGAFLGTSRSKVTQERILNLLDFIKKNSITNIMGIGGNGTMDVLLMINKMAAEKKLDLKIAGIPKTVDNDLQITDFSPGFGSAARFVALSVRDLGFDFRSLIGFDDVAIFECMGRTTGWLTASSILFKDEEYMPPHIVCVPETVFDEDEFLTKVQFAKKEFGYVVISVGEVLYDKKNQLVGIDANATKDQLNRTMYSLMGGIGAYLSDLIRNKLRLQCRNIRSNIMGRFFSETVSDFDYKNAQDISVYCVKQFREGNSEFMAINQKSQFCKVTLEEVAGKTKYLPNQFLSNNLLGVHDSFKKYCKPLVGEVSPVMFIDS